MIKRIEPSLSQLNLIHFIFFVYTLVNFDPVKFPHFSLPSQAMFTLLTCDLFNFYCLILLLFWFVSADNDSFVTEDNRF